MNQNDLVIVESPAKARTLLKILGGGFTVKASIGHIKDLPKKELGVDVSKEFKPHYLVIPGKEKIIKELKKASKDADRIFLAPDPDREGEAIAWHIAKEISDSKNHKVNEKIYRITFNEITDRAVKEAIKNPGKIDTNKVEAQQARRILDRLVGYKLSPLLWKKVRKGLSAGRVQSVAVKLIVDREREIEAFKPEEYWSINVEFEGSKPPNFWSKLYKINQETKTNSRFPIPHGEKANTILEDLKRKEFILRKIEHKLRKKKPSPPFITSTLQQEAARKLRFTAKKTMTLAQQLYEGIEFADEGSIGLITYMRTDSFRVAPDAQEWVKDFIRKIYGRNYLPENPPVYKSRSTAQEAHEAVRPTYSDKKPDEIKQFLTKDQYVLYKLIWNRFVASQMSPAQLEQTTFSIETQDGLYEFRTSGTVTRFDGFMVLYTESKDEVEDEEGGILPALREGEKLKLLSMQPKQHFTQPPPHYTEATLVKALEENGIGRPSTYATILSTIQERKYVNKTDNKFLPTELGSIVNDFLVERFPDLIDVDFTAKMENKLDRIEEGKLKWVKIVKDFYVPFNRDLLTVEKTKGKVKPKDIPTDTVCELCGLPMVIRWGRHGRFLACSGFPKCKNAKPLHTEIKEQNAEGAEKINHETKEICEKCGSPMVIKSGKYGKFLACSKYPECKNTKALSTGLKCPQDGGEIVERRSKKGRSFWSCSNYPSCHFMLWNKPVLGKCLKCGEELLLEKRDRTGKLIRFCHKKKCGYREEIEEPEVSLVT